MKRRSRDEEREQRITMEIVVDAYTPEEQAMGWYYSLQSYGRNLWMSPSHENAAYLPP